MPFKSKAQRRACWAQYNKAKKAGKEPSWDCREWERATKGPLPEKVRMPSGNTLIHAKQDIESYSTAELKALAHFYGLPETNRNDLCWLIAIHNFLGE